MLILFLICYIIIHSIVCLVVYGNNGTGFRIYTKEPRMDLEVNFGIPTKE